MALFDSDVNYLYLFIFSHYFSYQLYILCLFMHNNAFFSLKVHGI